MDLAPCMYEAIAQKGVSSPVSSFTFTEHFSRYRVGCALFPASSQNSFENRGCKFALFFSPGFSLTGGSCPRLT